MAEILRMPRLSDTMEEGNIVAWLKKEGDKVEPGTVLAEVETDKATMELESFHTGVLLYIGVKSGPVPVNGILAVIGKEGEDFQALLTAANSASTTTATPKAADTPLPVAESIIEPSQNVTSQESRIKASPLAKAIASDKGIDLHQVKGSGENGRIIRRDLESSQGASSAGTQIATVTYPTSGHTDNPLSQMRKVIAKRLSESKFTAPHFYLNTEIDMGKVMVARKEINESAGIKISINDFVVKACAIALQSNPVVNSSWGGDHIRVNHDINIGIAVAIDDGLMVPVVRNANYKTLSAINAEVKELATKAKERKLQPQEMQGNTFTISNLGMYDLDSFTAIINPPDACILAVGSIKEKPIVRDGQLAVGNMMQVTLSCDHRVVDGASGATFLMTLKSLLQEPVKMLV